MNKVYFRYAYFFNQLPKIHTNYTYCRCVPGIRHTFLNSRFCFALLVWSFEHSSTFFQLTCKFHCTKTSHTHTHTAHIFTQERAFHEIWKRPLEMHRKTDVALIKPHPLLIPFPTPSLSFCTAHQNGTTKMPNTNKHPRVCVCLYVFAVLVNFCVFNFRSP